MATQAYAPLVSQDVDSLILKLEPGVRYLFPDLYRIYIRIALSRGHSPASPKMLGVALARRCTQGRHGNRRTWMVELV